VFANINVTFVGIGDTDGVVATTAQGTLHVKATLGNFGTAPVSGASVRFTLYYHDQVPVKIGRN
jgi:hypothetical protein